MRPAVLASFTGADATMVVVIVVLLLFSVFLALAETGLTRMTRTKAQALADDGRPGSKSLLVAGRPSRAVPQPGAAGGAGLPARAGVAHRHRRQLAVRGWGVAIATFVNVVIVFVLAEAAPKTWAIQHPERAALLSARPVALLARFWPVRMLSRGLIGMANVVLPGKGLKEGPFVSEEELLALADVAVEDAVIEEEERDAHRPDHRVRRHHRARGHDATARHDHRRRRLPGRRRDGGR